MKYINTSNGVYDKQLKYKDRLINCVYNAARVHVQFWLAAWNVGINALSKGNLVSCFRSEEKKGGQERERER